MPKSSESSPGGLLTISDVEEFVSSQRAAGKTVALCHGVFDVLHYGHLNHLAEAANQADVLIVSVTRDEFVNKGPGRPVHDHFQRLSMLSALTLVDAVILSEHETAIEMITLVRPDVYVKGPDYRYAESDITGNMERERDAVVGIGGRLHITEGQTMSSSSIINSTYSVHGTAMDSWLAQFRSSMPWESVESFVSAVAGLNVAVVGEPILDEYVFVEPLGKTSKDPILAFLEGVGEIQLGGSLAIANHCAGLGATVTVTGVIGDDFPELASLDGVPYGVQLTVSDYAPTIRKTRFVDSHSGAKVFEKYKMADSPMRLSDEDAFITNLREVVRSADVVMVADYGHGLMSQRVIREISEVQGLLCVNTQSNAGNRGFNSVSRYPRVDFLSLNGSELALELKEKHISASELLPQIASRTGASTAIVTEGSRGVAVYSDQSGLVEVPALTQTVRDRVGAGDALFAATSLLTAVGAPTPLIGLVGNVAGAALVSDLGNRSSISHVEIRRHLQALLK